MCERRQVGVLLGGLVCEDGCELGLVGCAWSGVSSGLGVEWTREDAVAREAEVRDDDARRGGGGAKGLAGGISSGPLGGV